MNRSGRKRPRKPQKPHKSKRLIAFPEARGRTVETVELMAESEYHSVTIRFQDNTDLEVRIHPALSFTAALYGWKSGSQRVLKRWPTIQAR